MKMNPFTADPRLVVVVDAAAALEGAAAALLSCSVVGLDAEWKPVRRRHGKPHVALLQVAVRCMRPAVVEIYYLFDLLSLDPREVGRALRPALSSRLCLKLGYGFETDYRLLLAGTLASAGLPGSFDSYVDVRCCGWESSGGLAGLVNDALGRELSKAEQVSDWSLRPLSVSQVAYAATDVAVLLAIFDAAVNQMPSEVRSSPTAADDVPYDDGEDKTRPMLDQNLQAAARVWGERVCGLGPCNSASRASRGPRLRAMTRDGAPPPPTLATDFAHWFGGADPRFICDSTTIGLGRQLRLCGINCETVEPSPGAGSRSAYRAIAEIADRDGRVVLTQDKRFFAANHATTFLVNKNGRRDQLHEVQAAFGFLVDPGDVLSRCSVCNGDLVEATPAEALAASPELPLKVLELHRHFWLCTRCHKVYWEGLQWRRAVATLVTLTAGFAGLDVAMPARAIDIPSDIS